MEYLGKDVRDLTDRERIAGVKMEISQLERDQGIENGIYSQEIVSSPLFGARAAEAIVVIKAFLYRDRTTHPDPIIDIDSGIEDSL